MYNRLRYSWILLRVVPAAMLFGTPACTQLSSTMKTYTGHHDAAASELVLSFPAPPVRAGGNVYRDPLFGLKVEAVVADGEPVPREESMMLLDDIDVGTVPVKGDAHLYSLTTGAVAPSEEEWSLVTASAVTDDNFELEEYTIPRGTQRLQIRYRVRDPEGNALGPELTLESTAARD